MCSEKVKIPRGIRSNNPGNIRESFGDRTQWEGERATDDDKAFEEFVSMEHGIRALIITLRSYINKHKKDTVRKIITRWAPSNENNTEAYVNAVSKRTGIKPDEKVTFNRTQICRIVEAICFHENGGSYITNEQINRAWEMI
ncbi:MAG: structural protein [Syntrophorhabdaceae bacterium]